MEKGVGGGPGLGPIQEGPGSQGSGVADGVKSPTGLTGGSRRSQLASAQNLAVGRRGLESDLQNGCGGGEGGGPEEAGGAPGGGRGPLR